jgi:N-acetylglucosaminyldiphosphoundecaprenol N-acetyl-beta-D-mannosaminyltransferase
METRATVHRPNKVDICGILISATSYTEVVNLCDAWLAQKQEPTYIAQGRYICVTSVHGIVTAREDTELKEILNNADIATPDGMPVVWALRSFGQKRQERVYGPTLMLKLCERAAANGHRVFLYGGTNSTLDRLTVRLGDMLPDLVIAGTYSPPFRALTPAEEEAIRNRIKSAGTDILFVGISTPKQEKWMARQQGALPGTVMVGVGAAFNFHAGEVKQAPLWMQRTGLEWLFRLLSEPKRLWRRYILTTPRFIPYWASQWFDLLRH